MEGSGGLAGGSGLRALLNAVAAQNGTEQVEEPAYTGKNFEFGAQQCLDAA